MEIKIYKKEGVFGKVRNDRWGVIVEITNNFNQKFLYMPTYKELDLIYSLLKEVEEQNAKGGLKSNG